MDFEIVPVENAVRWLTDNAVSIGVASLGLLLLAWLLWLAYQKVTRPPLPVQVDLTIDVESLGATGPPATGPILEFYHLPARVAVAVLAPAGRGRDLPSGESLPLLLEAVVPGLSQVAAAQQTSVRRWPAQLSSSGFAHAFFANAKLPGDGGKGSCWSSLAGTAKIEGRVPLMVGLLFRTDQPTGFGQEIITSESDWLRILQIVPR